MTQKRAIAVKYPSFNFLEENPYQEEMDKLVDISLTEASTTRTIKNITECLTKALKSKYGIKDKEELKKAVHDILKLHGMSSEYLDPLAMVSKMTFGEDKNMNNISVDDNANKSSVNMEGIHGEAFLSYKKIIGYDFLYQVLKEMYGKEEAKKCCASMFDFSLALNDSTKITIPYCYCIDASKLVMVGRNFGQVHSSPAKRIDTYISVLGDTIREISFNIAGACLYKDTNLVMQQNGKTFSQNIKELVNSTSLTNNFNNYQGDWEYADVSNKDLYVHEYGKFTKVNKVMRRKYDNDIYVIKTKSGKTVKCSKDHRFKVLYKGRDIEVKAEDLKLYDTVYNSMLVKPFDVDKESADYKRGKFIGIICGDGSITNRNDVRVCVNNEQEYIGNFVEEYVQENYGTDCHKEPDKRGSVYNLRFHNSTKIYDDITKDIIGTSAVDKHIDVKGKNFDYLCGFLDGLMVTDGGFNHSVAISLISQEMIQNVLDICEMLNIRTSGLRVYEDKRGGNRKISYSTNVSLKLCQYLDLFNQKMMTTKRSANKRIDECAYFGKYAFMSSTGANIGNNCKTYKERELKIHEPVTDVIVEIETFKNDDEYVYEIETESHWYSVNGILTHNCAIGSLFLDVAHLAIYKERITLDDLRTDKKTRKYVSNCFQKLIHTVNHYSRNSIESPFTNVSLFDADKLDNLISDDNYGWYFPKKSAVIEDNNLKDNKEAYREFVKEYIEELQEIYIDIFDAGDPLRNGLQFPYPVTTCLPANEKIIINNRLTTFGEEFSEYDEGWTDVSSEGLYTQHLGKPIKINKVFKGNTKELLKIKSSTMDEIVVTPDHKFKMINGEYKLAKDLILHNRLMTFTSPIIYDNEKKYIKVSDYLDGLWVLGYKVKYSKESAEFVKNCNLCYGFDEDTKSWRCNFKKAHPLYIIEKCNPEWLTEKPEIDMVRTRESRGKASIPNILNLDEDFGRFLGLYYAEGHNSNGELGFSFNKNEEELINFVQSYLSKFGIKTNIRYFNSEGCQVVFYCKTLGLLLNKFIGKYCYGKVISNDLLFNTPIEFRKGLLRGCIEGDGNVNAYNCSINTTSEAGAKSLMYLGLSLGIRTKINKFPPRKPKEGAKIISKHDIFELKFNKHDIISNNYDLGKTNNFYIPKKSTLNTQGFYITSIEYIDTNEAIYNIEVDSDEHLYTLPNGIVTSNCNLAITIDEDGTRHLTDPNNRLFDYITSKDISKYNIYCSEGTKVASCCRLLSDADMLALGEGVNSFGGSQISLGSHRVITTDFYRIALEAESYDDFKKIVTERVEESAKILQAHRVLIHKLEKCGTQPWITNGWINMSHMFSTFGCVGYVEADQLLKEKFNHRDFDYMKDFLVYFNTECKRISDEYKMIWNIEAIPAEGMAPKLAKADKIIFADENGNYNYDNKEIAMPDILANQWCSLWEDHTIYEKMQRDGVINNLMTGGAIVHINVDSKVTKSQAKKLIQDAVKYGMAHFALNAVYVECQDCGQVVKGYLDKCPNCGSDHLNHYTRVIGYFSKVEGWGKVRREKDFPDRKFLKPSDIEKELG